MLLIKTLLIFWNSFELDFLKSIIIKSPILALVNLSFLDCIFIIISYDNH